MYLDKQIYFYAWNDRQKSMLAKCFRAGFLDSIGVTLDNFKSIKIEACYWRKVNSVHGWFVNNCQDGNDDCGTYYVGEEGVKQLYKAVCTVLEARGTPSEDEVISAMDLEPTQGCFFGSADIDGYYYEDLEQTKAQLEVVLADIEKEEVKNRARMKEIDDAKLKGKPFPESKTLEYGVDYYYHSSW